MAADLPHLRVSVVVASKGRPAELADTIRVMARQTLAPHRLIFSVTGPEDLPQIDLAAHGVETLIGPPGLPAQRNTALDACLADSDVIAFFDDDYVPEARALEAIARAFAETADLAGINGALLADGIHSAGLSLADAMTIVEQFEAAGTPERALTKPARGLHGCHMVFRASAIGAIRFDEELPAYGWQEDFDFSGQVRIAGGSIFRSAIFSGVHRGSKNGRSSGRSLGYSQIANPIYLARKGTLDWRQARMLMLRNFTANHFRALWPEPWVDRLGRVKGNWHALAEVGTGRLHPKRIAR